ncbi:proteinase-activated receptor 3-like [Dipodomys merriami]|uniref:proteinase-activated receptor 3-like n=1 Tax=Dipodomys merriami TaxID=94247 RepID=UPI0038556937
MKALIVAASRLLLLLSTICQSGMGNIADKSRKPNLTVRTLYGTPPNASEDFLLSAIKGWTGATINVRCPEGNVSHLHMNNVTVRYLKSSLRTKLIPAIYILVFVVGIPANSMTLWKLLFRNKPICLTIFHINLAIADILFCVTLPFKIIYHLNGNNWIFGEVLCRATTVLFYGNLYCSILLLTCMSISRYLAIVHPFTYRRLPKRKYTWLTCGVVWVMVFLYMLPFCILKQEYYLLQLDITTCHDGYSLCESSSLFQLCYFISLAVFGFLIPFMVVTYCYTNIIRRLNIHDQRWLRYSKAVVFIMVIFMVCFMPSNIILIAYHVNYYSHNTGGLYFSYLIALCLGSLNSCLDPFLYFLMLKMLNQPSAGGSRLKF